MTSKAFAGHDFFRKQQPTFLYKRQQRKRRDAGISESVSFVTFVAFVSYRSIGAVRRFLKLPGSALLSFACRENCLPGSGRKSFLHIFSGPLNQSLAGIQAKLVFDVFAVGLDRFHAEVQ